MLVQTPITDDRTKLAYFEQILDWGRVATANIPLVTIHASLSRWLIPAPVTWMHYQHDPLDATLAAQWERSHGRWQHTGVAHTQLGMAYAAWLERNPEVRTVTLADAPDLTATFSNGSRMYGDVGRCSHTALLESLLSIGQADMWVTVLNEREHLGLVFHYDVGRSIVEANAAHHARSSQ